MKQCYKLQTMINNKTPMNQMSLNKNDNSSSRSIRRIMNRISSK
jgi:hypothetical protein